MNINTALAVPLLVLGCLLASCSSEPLPDYIEAKFEACIGCDTLLFSHLWDLDYHNGFLYVADDQLYRVFKLDTTGRVLAIAGQRGDARGEFVNSPEVITVNEDSVFVGARTQILAYNRDLEYQHTYTIPEDWFGVEDLAVNDRGRLAVTTGSFLSEVKGEFAPRYPSAPSTWLSPTYTLNYLSFDRYYLSPTGDGNTFLAYGHVPRIEVYDSLGHPLHEWTLPYDCGDKVAYEPDRPPDVQVRTNHDAVLHEEVLKRCLISMDATADGGLILLNDEYGRYHHREVLHYDAAGTLLRRILLPEEYRRIAYVSDSVLYAIRKGHPEIHRLSIPSTL